MGNKLPPFYIGYTSESKIYAGYHGTVSSKKYESIWKSEIKNNSHLFKTVIISKTSNKEKALEREEYFQKKLNVVKNPLYINMAYGSAKFACMSHTEEWKRQNSIRMSGAGNYWFGKSLPEYIKEKMRKPKTEQHKEKLRKPKSKELAEILRNRNKNRVWVTDGIKDLLVKPETELSDGWRRGRHSNGLQGIKRGKYKQNHTFLQTK